MICDATCCPADIRFPTDVSLLNEGREFLEKVIDILYGYQKQDLKKKPRTYREKARREFLEFTKRRKPSKKHIRRAIKQQIQYIRRDLKHIEQLLGNVPSGVLQPKLLEKFETVKTMYEQQRMMYVQKTNRIENRIVSIHQPYVRPIKRGKAGKPTEFGAKITVSLSNGFCYLDLLSWDNFHEGKELKNQIEKYRERHGNYPKSVHVDKAYHSRENINYCKKHDIRLSAKPLGRPLKVTEENRETEKQKKKQRRQDEKDRNAVEGCFGVCKRKLGMDRIMAKTQVTNESLIHLSVLVFNLDKCYRDEKRILDNKYRIGQNRAS